MRIAVLLLAALLPLLGADWQATLNEGLTREDEGDSENARFLFERTCSDESVEPRGLRESCLALARIYALEGDLSKADSVLVDLLSKLNGRGSAADRVETLLQCSEVRAARGQLSEAVDGLREAYVLLPELGPVDRAHGLTEIGNFYLAVNLKSTGMPLLYRVQAELLPSLSLDDPGAVEALSENAAVLLWNGRKKDADALLQTVVEEARRTFARPEAISADLYDAYMYAAEQYSSVLRERGKKTELKAFEAETKDWRSRAGKALPSQPGVVEPPRLLRKVEPEYTPGARAAKVKGVAHLHVEIWPDGKAHHIRPLKRLGYGLTWNAIAAIRKWRFAPSTKLGEPVKATATIEVSFWNFSF